jgi:hypothetical protein
MPCLVFDLERGRAAFRKRVQLDQTSPESNKIGLSVYRPDTALLRDYAEYGLKSGAKKNRTTALWASRFQAGFQPWA